MKLPNPPVLRRLVILAVLIIISAACFGIYAASGRRFAPVSAATASYKPPLTNPEVVQDWLPADAYATMLARVDEHLRSYNLAATSMAVKGSVTFSPDTYDFDLLIQPQSQVLGVTVRISNSNSILSRAVFIKGPSTDPNTATTPIYGGFDTLIDRGVSITQVHELQQAFRMFAPTASSIAIATGTIAAPLDPSNPTVTYTFSVMVDGNAYNATFRCTGLTQAQLLLTDSSTKQQVFDSGVIASGQ